MENLTHEELEKRIADLRDLIANPMFSGILRAMRDHYVKVLESEPVGSLTATTAHAIITSLVRVNPFAESELRALQDQLRGK